jgi:hypothetical protein
MAMTSFTYFLDRICFIVSTAKAPIILDVCSHLWRHLLHLPFLPELNCSNCSTGTINGLIAPDNVWLTISKRIVPSDILPSLYKTPLTVLNCSYSF